MKELNKRLETIIPEGGGFDITFNLGAGVSKDSLLTTLNLVIFKKSEEGKQPQISRRVSVLGVGATVEEAQAKALETALDLLGA